MPMLKTDDEARHIPSVWLGPPDVVRWPFDASFTQWVLGFAMLLPVYATFSLFVPVALWFGLFWWYFPKFLTAKFPERVPALMRNSWTYRVLLLVLAVLVYFGNPKGFLLPMNFVAAIPFTLIASFLIVRKVSRYVTPMTPVRYWIGVLVEILRRPRESVNVSREFDVKSHVVVEFEDNFDLGDLANPRPRISLVKEVR